MAVQNAKQLDVYCKSYELAMTVFKVTKRFPAEERYSLISQVRRSSRSVCMNLAEAWAKRRYEAHFFSKLTDCDAEINETETSLDFAKDCGYLTEDEHHRLVNRCREIGRMFGGMIRDPEAFLLTKKGSS